MVHSRLTTFQIEILEAFFRETQGFFLTGGAALAGFYLGHRDTHDLDLFTITQPLESAAHALKTVAAALGARWEETQTAPDFRRLLVARQNEAVVVDLVFERTEQVHRDKPSIGTIRIDPAEEIFANKLCALLGRAEIRDLVDVRALERAGLSLADALQAATRKDGGLTPAQLAWVLSQLSIGADAKVPGGVAPRDLDDYRRDLIHRLAVMARP